MGGAAAAVAAAKQAGEGIDLIAMQRCFGMRTVREHVLDRRPDPRGAQPSTFSGAPFGCAEGVAATNFEKLENKMERLSRRYRGWRYGESRCRYSNREVLTGVTVRSPDPPAGAGGVQTNTVHLPNHAKVPTHGSKGHRLPSHRHRASCALVSPAGHGHPRNLRLISPKNAKHRLTQTQPVLARP